MLEYHLKSRYLNFNLHKVWLDEYHTIATFPLWNLSEQLLGYLQYRPLANKQKKNNPKEGRYFTYLPKQSVGVWGLESWRQSDTLYVTEGVFDAARLTNSGLSAIALLSNDLNDSLKAWLRIVRSQRKVVAVCDGDAAGLKLAKAGHCAIVVKDNKDVSSLTKTEYKELLNELVRH